MKVGLAALAPGGLTAAALVGIRALVREEGDPFDRAVTDWVREQTPSTWKPGLMFLSRLLGLGGLLVPVVGLLLATAYLLHRRGRRCEAAGLLVAVIMTSAVVGTARRVFARARPEVEWALGHAPGGSYPSGHAASAVVYFGMLTYLVWKLTRRWPATLAMGTVTLGVSVGTGWSRVYLGVHYPSDVLAGYLVGLIWLGTGIGASEVLARTCWRVDDGCGAMEGSCSGLARRADQGHAHGRGEAGPDEGAVAAGVARVRRDGLPVVGGPDVS